MNESLAVYDKTLTAEDFTNWFKQRTNVLTLVCLIVEVLVVAASIVLAVIGLTRHTASASSLITELILVVLLLGFVIYWRFGYPKSAGLRYFQRSQRQGPVDRVTTFYPDKFQIKAADNVESTVLYSDVKSYKVKHGLLTIDGQKHMCYIFREDGFTGEELEEITSAIKKAKEN